MNLRVLYIVSFLLFGSLLIAQEEVSEQELININNELNHSLEENYLSNKTFLNENGDTLYYYNRFGNLEKDYRYDEYGNLVYKQLIFYPEGNFQLNPMARISYDGKGNVLEAREFILNKDHLPIKEQVFDSSQKCILTVLSEYNSTQDLLKRDYLNESNVIIKRDQVDYEYVEAVKGYRPIKNITYGENLKVEQMEIYVYDTNDLHQEQIFYQGDSLIVGREVFVHDSNKNLVKSTYYDGKDRVVWFFVREYGANNRPLSQKVYDFNNELEYEEIYVYDSNGNHLEPIVKKYRTTKEGIEQEHEYEYHR